MTLPSAMSTGPEDDAQDHHHDQDHQRGLDGFGAGHTTLRSPEVRLGDVFAIAARPCTVNAASASAIATAASKPRTRTAVGASENQQVSRAAAEAVYTEEWKGFCARQVRFGSIALPF